MTCTRHYVTIRGSRLKCLIQLIWRTNHYGELTNVALRWPLKMFNGRVHVLVTLYSIIRMVCKQNKNKQTQHSHLTKYITVY